MTTYLPSCDFSFADLLAAIGQRHPDNIQAVLSQRHGSETALDEAQARQREVGRSRSPEDASRQRAAWRWYRDVTATYDASPQNTMAELEDD